MRDPAGERSCDAETLLGLAHALRTPVTALALGLGLLDEGVLGELKDEQRDIVRTLVGEVARITRLLERNLDIERLGTYTGPVERDLVDLGELVRRAAVPIERQAHERGVRVRLDLPRGVVVAADSVKLSWIAVSLMGNALRYSPAGSQIEVEIEGAHERTVLRVRDHGPGLKPEVEAQIFERTGGPGLCLAREIVEMHGGTIDVRSVPGRGSTFTVTLPSVGPR